MSAAAVLVASTMLSSYNNYDTSKNSLDYKLRDTIILVEDSIPKTLDNKTLSITIDPGHDTKYIGCRVKGYKEEILNLDISKRLDSLLRENYNIFLTREDQFGVNTINKDFNNDKKISVTDELLARSNYISSTNSNLALSIHYNYHPRYSRVQGMEVYFYGVNSLDDINDGKLSIALPKNCKIYSNESLLVAEKMVSYAKDRGITLRAYGSDMRILRENPAKITLLIEVGYLTNKYDFKNAITENGRRESAKFLADFFNEHQEYLRQLVGVDIDTIQKNILPSDSSNLITKNG
ncbi:MAG: N-acetylmuramoyl-L-alanine amidase family protein [Candidatus Woesearchaeota archaeon]